MVIVETLLFCFNIRSKQSLLVSYRHAVQGNKNFIREATLCLFLFSRTDQTLILEIVYKQL